MSRACGIGTAVFLVTTFGSGCVSVAPLGPATIEVDAPERVPLPAAVGPYVQLVAEFRRATGGARSGRSALAGEASTAIAIALGEGNGEPSTAIPVARIDCGAVCRAVRGRRRVVSPWHPVIPGEPIYIDLTQHSSRTSVALDRIEQIVSPFLDAFAPETRAIALVGSLTGGYFGRADAELADAISATETITVESSAELVSFDAGTPRPSRLRVPVFSRRGRKRALIGHLEVWPVFRESILLASPTTLPHADEIDREEILGRRFAQSGKQSAPLFALLKNTDYVPASLAQTQLDEIGEFAELRERCRELGLALERFGLQRRDRAIAKAVLFAGAPAFEGLWAEASGIDPRAHARVRDACFSLPERRALRESGFAFATELAPARATLVEEIPPELPLEEPTLEAAADAAPALPPVSAR